MNTGMIGPRAAIENTRDASERLLGPEAVGHPRDTRDGVASAKSEDPPGLRKIGDASSRVGNDPRKLAHAAQEFESLLLAQILRSVREAGSGGWLGSSESQEMSSTMELAETQLARAMAQSGALGITKLLAGELPADSREAGAQRAESAAEGGDANWVEDNR